MNQFYGPSKLDKSFATKASPNTATAVVLDTLDLAVSDQPTGTKAVNCGKSGRWMANSLFEIPLFLLVEPTRQITFSTNKGKSSVAMPIRKSAKGRSSAGFWVSTDDTAKTKHFHRFVKNRLLMEFFKIYRPDILLQIFQMCCQSSQLYWRICMTKRRILEKRVDKYPPSQNV
uniref:Uncharacterized protein n=1 Tax=Romanomermis culicivorax TaxID=13658 RepID=A0A915LCL5_ROMCU